MRKVPIVATLIVLVAIGFMIRLGLWQIDRLHQKEALLARLAHNANREQIVFPLRPYGDELLFRRASLDCRVPAGSVHEGAGKAGTRLIVTCRNGARVQLGTSLDPRFDPRWPGGMVTGMISYTPDHRPLIAAIFDHSPRQLMLIADPPLAGLGPNALPRVAEIPNNHLSYAIQWFLFAATALVIYLLALRSRMRR